MYEQAEIDERFRKEGRLVENEEEEETREDESLTKKIMIEGGDIKRNERQEADLQNFQEGRA